MIVLSIQTKPLLRLLHHGKPYQAQIWGAIANSILNTIFDLALPYLIGIAIDVVVNEENSLMASLGIFSITIQELELRIVDLIKPKTYFLKAPPSGAFKK